LHPTCIVLSEWDTEVRPWEGNILTTVINEFSDLDGQGHGVKLEGMDMLPGISLSFAPWNSGAEYKSRLLRYPNTQGHIVLCREKHPGRVRVDAKTGKLLIDYTPSVLDRKHLLEGILEMCKVLYTMGAKEISTATAGAPIWRRDDTTGTAAADQPKRPADGWAADPRFLDFLAALNARGLPLDLATFGSAHQMGTCRMGSSPTHSVVDQRGRVWGCEGLYVADASVFPSASGVNPMLTTMAFGRWIGRRLAEELKSESGLSSQEDVNSKL
jgi:choline dehydrogenase-like flavoprotein